MNNKKSIIVYGGSFNPPLNSHFSIAENVLNQYEKAEKVIFIPVNKTYGKKGLIENQHRFNMLKKVIDKNNRFILSDVDFKEEKKSLTTIEVMKIIQTQYPNYEICFLMGSDNLKELPTWSGVEELVSTYKILVMSRDDDNFENIVNENEFLMSNRNNLIKLNEDIRSNFSSRYVRNQIKNNKSVRYLLPDEVYEYIKENKLYQEE